MEDTSGVNNPKEDMTNNKEISSEYREEWDAYDKNKDKENKTNLSQSSYEMRKIDISNIQSYLDKSSNHGMTGLHNLGNTCFMNSALQCMSHSIDLTCFFLSKDYKREINPNNKLGLKGKLANVYYEMIKSLWVGSSVSYSPSEFKLTISRRASQFAGFGQQDSHELLTFLLDGLHEDMNQVTSKEYKELKEKQDDENDIDAAKRFWDFHLTRNSSIIVDLFHGQFKSTITCPKCKRVSETFDPFTTVGLPIPKLEKVEVYVVPSINFKKTIKLTLSVSRDALFYDIAGYVNKQLEHKIGKFRCMTVKNNDLESIVKAHENIYTSAKNKYIFCNEIDEEISKEGEFFPIFVNIRDAQNKDGGYYSFPRMFTVKNSQNVKDFKIQLYGFVRRYFNLSKEVTDVFNSKYDELLDKYTKEKIFDSNEYFSVISTEYDVLFEEQNTRINSEIKKSFLSEFPFAIFLENGDDKTYFFTSNPENKKFDDNLPITEVLKMLNGSKSKVVVQILTIDKLLPEKIKQMNVCVTIIQNREKALSLIDCIEHFRVTEKLEKNNEWYCNKCKKHMEAYKKMDLFYCPKLLIFQLKRFEYSSVGRYRTYSEKIGTNIEFPLDNLDLSNYIVGPLNPKPVYELYAVSQHFGSTGGGHYTAVATNLGKWYDYNDSSVSSTRENSIQSSSAYLLFYRRKD